MKSVLQHIRYFMIHLSECFVCFNILITVWLVLFRMSAYRDECSRQMVTLRASVSEISISALQQAQTLMKASALSTSLTVSASMQHQCEYCHPASFPQILKMCATSSPAICVCVIVVTFSHKKCIYLTVRI